MEAKYAHNIVIELLAETGTIGILCFLIFFAVFIFSNRKHLFKPPSYLLPGILFGLTAAFFHTLCDFDYADASFIGLFFLFAGLADRHPKNEAGFTGKLTKPLSGFIIICILTAGIFEGKIWRSESYLNVIYSGQIEPSLLSETFEKATSVYPEPEVYFVEGEILWKMFEKTGSENAFSDAMDDFRKAVSLNPYSVKYHRKIAFACYETKQYSEAEREFLKVLELYPTKLQYNMEMGFFYEKTGMPEKAKQYFDNASHLRFTSLEEVETVKNYQNGKNF